MGDDAGSTTGSDAGSSTCSSQIDLTSDPDNCGACGHSCNGGACQASLCQPVALAIGQNNPQGIAVDTGNVYWTSGDGTVQRMAIAGGAPTTLASGQTSPFGVAVDATRVYWTNKAGAGSGGAVMSVLIAGGGQQTLASAQGAPDRVIVTGGALYWTN
ncbi:MAG TPA: hypothetical protein VK601_26830, partial [Kofleriaceae bacterium]|nr:hypothetical protein [Kofleriaceae bacterium]